MGAQSEGWYERGFVKKSNFMEDKSINSTSGKSTSSMDFAGRKCSEFGGDRVLIGPAELGVLKMS